LADGDYYLVIALHVIQMLPKCIPVLFAISKTTITVEQRKATGSIGGIGLFINSIIKIKTMAKIWELVKQCEEDLDTKGKEFGEMIATLIANYSELNKGRHPVVISSKDSPMVMLFKVLEYHHSIPNAIYILKNELSRDKLEGSCYHTWQANIAMSFYDAVRNLTDGTNVFDEAFGDGALHEVSNKAAKNFLDLLISQSNK
jgi:hypothetical protein